MIAVSKKKKVEDEKVQIGIASLFLDGILLKTIKESRIFTIEDALIAIRH